MKLLIADDETLTRQGLVSSIDWKSLGITEIYEADDGIHGLHIARQYKPDIILSDVRMPRMDGIHMAEEIHSFLPDATVIFMSGYSDKEYLKAAIKLKAIDYVEKPLNPEEIYESVKNAALRLEQTLRTRKTETLYSLETSSHLALLFTMPYKEQAKRIQSLTAELGISSDFGSFYITYIVKLNSANSNPMKMQAFYADFQEFLSRYHLRVFYIRSHVLYHVFHLMGNNMPSEIALSDTEKFLQEYFCELGDYYISCGEIVSGISRVYQSYMSAVVNMQSSFFFMPGTVLTPKLISDFKKDLSSVPSFDSLVQDYSHVLTENSADACERFLRRLYENFSQNSSLLPNQIKDLYYKFFNTLNICRQKQLLTADTLSFGGDENIMDALEHCFSYTELHQLLVERTNLFFQALSDYTPEDATIFKIKEYIARHYMKNNLSIKEISEHVYLSASYVCTYFKAQTGQTLNQYLTKYRMEKAMQLLGDERYQITEISAKVGYHDDNYFSKSFKKFTGLSPSKYREKMLG